MLSYVCYYIIIIQKGGEKMFVLEEGMAEALFGGEPNFCGCFISPVRSSGT
jgi:hypothetical protein